MVFTDNSMYGQQAAPDAAVYHQQYNNMQQPTYQQDAPQPISMPHDSQYNKPAVEQTSVEEAELNFDNGPMTFESTAMKQQQQHSSGKPHNDGRFCPVYLGPPPLPPKDDLSMLRKLRPHYLSFH